MLLGRLPGRVNKHCVGPLKILAQEMVCWPSHAQGTEWSFFVIHDGNGYSGQSGYQVSPVQAVTAFT